MPAFLLWTLRDVALCWRQAIAGAFLLVAAAQPASALTIPIIVDSPADVVNALDGLCTPREALLAAASGSLGGGAAGECGGSLGDAEIGFATSAAFPANAVITLGNAGGALPDIVNKVHIFGPITIDAGSIGDSDLQPGFAVVGEQRKRRRRRARQ